MRKMLALVVILAILPVPAEAEMCVLDVVPAATILVPYFEVDLADSSGRNTIVVVHNATAEPTLVHVTFWTNWGAPVLDYDVFLTGFDVQTFDLRDHFRGNVAVTADEESDPDDTISPSGSPTWDGSFSFCDLILPFVNPAIGSVNLERLVDGHTGEPISSLDNECLGGPTPEADLAVGYLTMDVTGECSLEFPSDLGYFGGTDPIALDENRLWAEVLYVDPSREVTLSMSAVHVEADPDFDATSTSTGATFYGRFTAGADHREPLPSEWGAPVNNAVSDLLVWREASGSYDGSWDCSSGPAWNPLEENEVTCFDPTGAATGLCGGTPCFPLALQRTPVFPLGWPGATTGWCRFDLGTGDSEHRQSWIGVIDDEGGSVISGMPAIVMDGACQAP